MGSLVQDIRYSLRIIRKHVGFSLAVAITLSLGIGANTTIFSIIQAVLLRPLPYEDPDRLTILWSHRQQIEDSEPVPALSAPDFFDYREQTKLLEELGAAWGMTAALVGEGDPEQVQRIGVTANFFPLLGVEPMLGRNFTEAEDVPNGPQLAILSYRLWQRRYGRDPGILGRTIHLNGENHTVVGVLPDGFRLWVPKETLIWTTPVDVWVNLRYERDIFPRQRRHLLPIGRLKPGVSTAQAQAEADRIAEWLRDLDAVHKERGFALRAVPMHQDITKSVRPGLLALWGAVGFLLLVVCANVANLFLAANVRRQSEIALRNSLGASRLRILRQLLTEYLVLTLASATLGLFLAWAGLRAVRAASLANVPRLDAVSIDSTGLAFTLLVSLLTGLLFGLVPAFRAVRSQPYELLKEGARAGASQAQHRLVGLLVVSQVGLSVLLLIGAGLMIRTFSALQDVRPGFDPEDVLTFRLSLPEARYLEDADRVRFYRQLEENLAALPGVEKVGGVSVLPLTGAGTGMSGITYRDLSISADYRLATPDYFEAMGTKLLAGRFFTYNDFPDDYRIIIVDETFARRLWPNESAVGKRLVIEGRDVEIVGVVENLRSQSLSEKSRAQMYQTYQRVAWPRLSIIVRAKNPTSLVPAIKQEITNLDKSLPMADVRLMEEYVSDVLAPSRLITSLLGGFAGVALLLACIGIYGVLSYVVSERAREMGIRMAFGADRRTILGMVLEKGMRLVVIGMAIGLIGAVGLTRFLSGMLFGVTTTDPLTFVVIAVVFALVGAMACLVPARRAASVDPMTSLRYE